jgi:hypothetical protein
VGLRLIHRASAKGFSRKLIPSILPKSCLATVQGTENVILALISLSLLIILVEEVLSFMEVFSERSGAMEASLRR